MLLFLVGLILGMQLGYWAWSVTVWGKQVLFWLRQVNAARKNQLPQVIQPEGTPASSPSVVKPKTPRQIAIEKLKTVRERGL